MAREWLGGLPEDVQRKITVGNAAHVYDFTPADPATLVPAGQAPQAAQAGGAGA
jgi:hypothetical protein